jgi:hypothetical protein
LEGIENLIKLIKNNNIILNDLCYNFIDQIDYMELNILFDDLVICKDKNNEKIEQIEKMIVKLNGFQKCILK